MFASGKSRIHLLILIILIIALLIMQFKAFAQILDSSYFFVSISGVNKDYYLGGEYIKVYYKIRPAYRDLAQYVDDRFYTVYTNLQDSSIIGAVIYMTGFTRQVPFSGEDYCGNYDGGKYVQINVVGTLEGLAGIDLQISGKIPHVNERLKKVTLIWFDVADSKKDTISPVSVYVVNSSKFELDIENLNEILSSCKSKIKYYANYGLDVSYVEELANSVAEKISEAIDYYSDGEYASADNSLRMAESLLNELMYNFESLESEKLNKLANQTSEKEEQIDSKVKSGEKQGEVASEENLNQLTQDIYMYLIGVFALLSVAYVIEKVVVKKINDWRRRKQEYEAQKALLISRLRRLIEK